MIAWAQRDSDGRVYVAVRPICEALGVNWPSQWVRIKRDAILAEGVVVTTTPSDGGRQKTVCLPLEYLNGWLFGISERRVKPGILDKLLAYKRECYRVLFAHFYGAAVEKIASILAKNPVTRWFQTGINALWRASQVVTAQNRGVTAKPLILNGCHGVTVSRQFLTHMRAPARTRARRGTCFAVTL